MSSKNYRANFPVKGVEAEVQYTLHLKKSDTRKCGCKKPGEATQTVAVQIRRVSVNGKRLSHKDHAAKAAARELRHTLMDGHAVCEHCLASMKQQQHLFN